MSEKTKVENAGIYAALFAVQQEVEGIVKGENNPFFKSKYADRTTILQVLKPIFAKNNLLLIQAPVAPSGDLLATYQSQNEEDGHESYPVFPLALQTTIVHVPTGENITSVAVVPMPQPDPQGFGSAMTYTSRYSIISLLALPLLDDDDGNAASPVTTGKVTKTKTARGNARTATSSPAAKTDTATGAGESTTQTSSASTAAKAEQPAKQESQPQSASSTGTATKGRKLWGGK